MIKGIIMVSILSTLLSIIGCSKQQPNYQQEDIYKELRNKAFSITPTELKITKEKNKMVYSIIMETGYEDAVVSLIAMGDGSVSLYFSNGGGIIGLGEHEKPRKICLNYIDESNNYMKLLQKTESKNLPEYGETIFYFLTYDGIYFHKEKEDILGNNKSKFSKLFHKAHELIKEARIIDEKRRSNN